MAADREIYLERERFLQSADNLLEEMLAEAVEIVPGRAETVCCGVLIDTVLEAETAGIFPVCGNNCRKFIENAATKIEVMIK